MQLGLASSRQGEYALAVDYLGNSIRIDPASSEALFARGKAFQRLGEFSAAAQDYHLAYQLARTPLFAACEGYCLSRTKYHLQAITLYRSALEGGYDSPALLYNNIGRDYFKLGQIDHAEENLQRAIQLDDNLQAAHCNMVQIFVDRVLRGQSVPAAALISAKRALEIGPCTGKLYRDSAVLYATAAKQDPTLIQPAIQYVKSAIELGYDPKALASINTFASLRSVPAFRNAMQSHVSTSGSPRAPLLLDPLDKR